MSATVLRIENLRKSYRSIKREVLSGLNMRIGKGEIYGFLGPNGAGKTTTVNILTGLLKEDSGVIEIFGECEPNDRRKVMKRMGVVPQSIALYSELTAYENLFFSGRYTECRVKKWSKGEMNYCRCLDLRNSETKR